MSALKSTITTPASVSRPAKDKTNKKDAGQRQRQAERAAVLLKYMSDPTRLQVVLMLAAADKHTGGLSEALNQPQPAVSHHLALLRHGQIVEARRAGKNTIYTLTETGMKLAKVVNGIVG